ncbi:MAG: protein translocase subunit SecD, partial [Spirochaetales bacterium]|nr:protein translocase subunit SecD [Spirochaetales bacterium]
MSKRARLLVVLLVLVAGGVFLYPTFNWYYMVPQDQKELAAGSKEQIQSYSRGRASRDLVELKDLVSKDQNAAMPDKF